MLTRRDFLKGLLTTIAATAVTRNGVLRPPEELETPKRTIFDMAQNTWRETYRDKGLSLAPVAYLHFGGGSIVRFSAECGELFFPSREGGLVLFNDASKSWPVGIVLGIENAPGGTHNYLVDLRVPTLRPQEWRFQGRIEEGAIVYDTGGSGPGATIWSG